VLDTYLQSFQSTPSPAQHQAPSNSLQKKRLKKPPKCSQTMLNILIV
jgi:hypothetical protein